MTLVAFDHVQLAMPEGGEDRARAFYGSVLDLAEVPKPPALAGRGGVWFANETLQVHLGVDADFRAARKAHPAFLVSELDELAKRCEAAGFVPAFDDRLPGRRRFFLHDPFGNRLEFLGTD